MRYILILATVILCGCGQKGALYLPEDAKPAAPTESAANPQSAQ